MLSQRPIFSGRSTRIFAIAAILFSYASIAVASGWPPFSVDDSATVKRGATVSILDSGESSVLANDFDLEGDTLTAELKDDTKHGDLTLNEDGTFIYRHDGSSKDEDQFRYRAFDGERYSREATVKIQITPGDPIAPQIVGQQEVTVPEDESVEIRLRDLEVVDPDNDYPRDFTLEVGDGDNYTRIDATITPLADFNGQLTVAVRVNDGTNFSNWFDLLIDVTPQNDAPFVVSPVPDQETIEGVELMLSLAEHFDDIDDGDSLRFSAQGLPPSGTFVLDADTGLLRGTAIRADARDTPYSVSITATDSAGANVELTFGLTILRNNNADIAISSRVAQNPTLVGEPSSWIIEIENQGPAELTEGELVSSWATSGPAMSLATTTGCTIESNDSPTPTLRCLLAQLPAGALLSFDVQGMQDGDGDNTLIAEVVADDPVTDNNTTMVSAQVAIAFSEGPTQALNQAGAGLAAADFNADGLLDLVASNNQTIVYFNMGDRSLQTTGTVIGSGGPLLTILDWNGDGLDDVAVAGPSAGIARVYLGDGSGLFADQLQVSTQVQGEAKTLSGLDIDGDGTSELVLAGTFGALIARNQETGPARIDMLLSSAVLDIAVTDFDQDNYPDLVAIAADDRSVKLLRNLANGAFVLQNSMQEGSVARVSVADLDNDGLSDLLLAIDGEDLSTPHTKLMLRQSDGSYVVATTLGASTATELMTGDLNGDGLLDVIALNETGVHQVYVAGAGAQYKLDAEQIISPGMQS
ncbi:MAG: FG-GAP-like repeat-containing protein, partial [Woeseiaceae bacterium]